jgi:hypothetical protein
MVRALLRFRVVGLPMLLVACTGQIDPPDRPGPGEPGRGSGSSGAVGRGPAGGAVAPPANETPAGQPPQTIAGSQSCLADRPGPRLLRRLTAEQLDNSVRDLFGSADVPRSDVFNDPQVLGFTGDAASLLVRDLGTQQLMNHAERVARWAVTNVGARIAPCNQMTPECRAQFVRQFGLRAFREPPDDDMVTRYEALFASGGTFERGLELTITAMLQSPFFLYRRELGVPDPRNAGTVRLTPYEVASNISYLIARSMPDEQLLQAAAANQLSTLSQIDAQVDRLLQNPEHRATINRFVGEWLESKQVEGVLKDVEDGVFNDALRASMLRETAALVEDVVFTRNGTLTDLLTTDYTFVDASLARHYGIAGVTGDQLVKVNTRRDPGILVQGSMMTGHGGAQFSSPTLRGKLVRTRLLCEDLPPPPDDVDTMIKVPENAKTTRQIFETHAENASCSGCHRTMDLIGYAFENYDFIGRYRTEENGIPVDTSGEILGRNFKFQTLRELNDYLASSEDVRQCMVRFMSYYAYGASGWADGGCTLNAISAEAKASSFTMRSVLTAITHAPHFTSRVQ